MCVHQMNLNIVSFLIIYQVLANSCSTSIRNWVLCQRRRAHILLSIAGIRTLLTTLSPREIQVLTPSTRGHTTNGSMVRGAVSLSLCSSALPGSRSVVHWIGIAPDCVKSDFKRILFFQDCGYSIPLGLAHLDWCLEAYLGQQCKRPQSRHYHYQIHPLSQRKLSNLTTTGRGSYEIYS